MVCWLKKSALIPVSQFPLSYLTTILMLRVVHKLTYQLSLVFLKARHDRSGHVLSNRIMRDDQRRDLDGRLTHTLLGIEWGWFNRDRSREEKVIDRGITPSTYPDSGEESAVPQHDNSRGSGDAINTRPRRRDSSEREDGADERELNVRNLPTTNNDLRAIDVDENWTSEQPVQPTPAAPVRPQPQPLQTPVPSRSYASAAISNRSASPEPGYNVADPDAKPKWRKFK
jgi:hypothetical protein